MKRLHENQLWEFWTEDPPAYMYIRRVEEWAEAVMPKEDKAKEEETTECHL